MSHPELQNINPEYLDYDYKDEAKCQERLREHIGQYPNDIGKWGYLFIKHGGGYYKDTMQLGLTIAVPRRCPFKERIKEELTRAMEFVKPMEDGIKRISIFEHTLSEFASYNVIYDNGWAIERSRSYHQETSKTSLDEVVNKLVTIYWYNDPSEDMESVITTENIPLKMKEHNIVGYGTENIEKTELKIYFENADDLEQFVLWLEHGGTRNPKEDE